MSYFVNCKRLSLGSIQIFFDKKYFRVLLNPFAGVYYASSLRGFCVYGRGGALWYERHLSLWRS